jgi:5-formyltetrahydrofolate cyclo-ligase
MALIPAEPQSLSSRIHSAGPVTQYDDSMITPSPQPENPAEISRAKSDLRRTILRRRTARPQQQRNSDDAARLALLEDVISQTAPETVATYFSTPPEPATGALIDWLAARGVRVLLPVLTEPSEQDRLLGPPSWAPYAGPDRLRTGRLSITEPDTDPLGAAGLTAAQVIVCPGLAGDPVGRRLGRGGGWYDRALADAASTAITLLPLNDDEVTESVPADHRDWCVDLIVTPGQIIDCRKNATR